MVSEDWLRKLNKEFRESGVEKRRRPWDAIRRYETEFNVSVDFSSDLAKLIFEWFKLHSKPDAHQVGNLYDAVFFYDSEFWLVSIPIVFGTVKLNAIGSLSKMPEHIKKELISDNKQALDYMLFWADCVDYGMGLDDLKKTGSLNSYGMQLLMAGDQELRSATSILEQPRPGFRAILTCRMAVEIFLKSFIALKEGLTKKQAKEIGHDLNKGLNKFIEVSGYYHWEAVRGKLSNFPSIDERYKEQDVPLNLLWDGFSIAQSLGAVIIREYTGRNMLEQVKGYNSGRHI